jgi:ribosome-associated toxin RatA of RatAB toxin-antitoxin module
MTCSHSTARARSFRCLIFVVGLLSAGAVRAEDSLETTVKRAGSLLKVRANFSVDAPAATCYAVLADFDRLEEFVPGLRSSDVISGPGEPIRLHQVGDASAGFFHVTLDVTLAVRERPPERIDFDRIAGNLKQMRGTWTVAGDDRHCGIVYSVDIEPEFWVPPLIGPLLMRNQVEAQLEGVLAELRRRAGTGSAATP